ncbi:hypothetical protein A2V68_00390 [candidate division Kazan bacterium RBG_13_50_9]|uniref:IrrE N-terminal-like domain-containing protein n=1 Tax=candidate division Kazan bacterium RBG_13_50_9 TaxID=1798535 RepID=A0A1F4NRT8_UNCK3|nr:MAG: hypothetical protein A2V68_00390 [candidate division Kazan bacterium RBG_13_50_9]
MFDKLKRVLIHSGYQVILTGDFAHRKSGGLARGTKGYILPDDLKIFINKHIGINDRVLTLVHELLHEIYSAWEEPRIDRTSQRIFRNLTVSQLGFLQFFVMSPTEIRSTLKSRQFPVSI